MFTKPPSFLRAVEDELFSFDGITNPKVLSEVILQMSSNDDDGLFCVHFDYDTHEDEVDFDVNAGNKSAFDAWISSCIRAALVSPDSYDMSFMSTTILLLIESEDDNFTDINSWSDLIEGMIKEILFDITNVDFTPIYSWNDVIFILNNIKHIESILFTERHLTRAASAIFDIILCDVGFKEISYAQAAPIVKSLQKMTTIKLWKDKETEVTIADGYFHSDLRSLIEHRNTYSLFAQFRIISIGFSDRIDAFTEMLSAEFRSILTKEEKSISYLIQLGIRTANAIDEEYFIDPSFKNKNFRDVIGELLLHNDPDIRSLVLSLYAGNDFWDHS